MFEITVERKDGSDPETVRCALDSCELGKSKDSIVPMRGWKLARRHVLLEKNLAGIFIKDIRIFFLMTFSKVGNMSDNNIPCCFVSF